ncbi:chemotaxis protein cheC [Thermococcus kodakarensis KOD1]|uniref:Chemotaxis protein cheC n=1 Tax=Thermococcus kodakarensis (strain ATCC BAA-918 / JCM 12380 / KOD1) TaxID=69014 RepID=Q5JF91_THEKO|nr:chemotaxis protein CheC [Thermococcus kodakarensis]WCN28679.1 chemotaxis protein CheC [Thermococcus kodakarensis]WCN30977.1 chemotaxis protein CheC [Thermococcus kodakarensis]BAD84826.1 chemotaxis protein cheC [Thermococcus kodakarensis KOD1]
MKISEWYKDIFREASNIAMSHALTSLSEMVGGPIEMEPPEVEVLSRVEFLKRLTQNGISNSFVVAFDITEGLGGLTVLQFPTKSAINLSAALMGMDPSGMKELDEMGKSAITEVGNILISVYTDILAKLVGEPVSLSPPKPINSLYDIEKELNRPDLRNVDKIMLFKTRFYEENIGFESFFYLVPDEESFEKLVKRLEAQVKEEGGE